MIDPVGTGPVRRRLSRLACFLRQAKSMGAEQADEFGGVGGRRERGRGDGRRDQSQAERKHREPASDLDAARGSPPVRRST